MKTRGMHLDRVELKRTRSRVVHLSMKTEGCTSAELTCSQVVHLGMKTRGLHFGRVELKMTRSRAVHLGMKTRGLHLDRAYKLSSRAPRQKESRPAPRSSLYAPEPCTSAEWSSKDSLLSRSP
ncbi:hypothetical protein BHE74_00020075 [Ensete ventricosum]|nr:hypothetical protein BHE74_00020075 [Ensete ventricosum]